MNRQKLWKRFANLTPEARRKVLDLIGALAGPELERNPTQKPKKSLADDPFVGMWKNRADLGDASAWVKGVRLEEWKGKRG